MLYKDAPNEFMTSMGISIEIDYLEQFDVVETEEAAEDVVGK